MTPTSEFSHKVAVEPWPEDGVTVELTATAAEREALRARFDLVELSSLSASVEIEKKSMEWVLTGTIVAVVAQTCVVTLKPVTSTLQVPFERHYRTPVAHEKMMAGGDAAGIEEDVIDVEILDGDEIDVGEAVSEEFYLALDPYPRGSGADHALEAISAKIGSDPDDRPGSPFEKLRQH